MPGCLPAQGAELLVLRQLCIRHGDLPYRPIGLSDVVSCCVKNDVLLDVVSEPPRSLTHLDSYQLVLYQVIPVHVTWMCGKATAQALATGSQGGPREVPERS